MQLNKHKVNLSGPDFVVHSQIEKVRAHRHNCIEFINANRAQATGRL